MQIRSAQEMAGRAFYFDRGELIANREDLPDNVPRVIVPETEAYAASKGDMLLGEQINIFQYDEQVTDVDASIITTEGDLVVMDREGEGPRARKVVELLVATKMITNRLEAARVEQRLGVGHSLRELFRNNPLVSQYVEFFEEIHGETFVPIEEPRRLFAPA